MGNLTFINLLCSPYVLHAKFSMMEMSSKSPDFIECCPNLNIAKVSQPQCMMRLFQLPVHTYHIQDGLPVLLWIGAPLDDSDLLEAPSLFLVGVLLKLSNSWTLLAEGLLRKPWTCLLYKWTANIPCASYLSSSWSFPWLPMHICQGQAQVL